MKARRTPWPRRQRGLTLIELLVALTISLLVAIAAVATLIASRTGFSTVDATSQVVDRERFAIDTLYRVIGQAGFEDWGAYPLATRAIDVKSGNDPEPDLFGWNDAFYTQLDDLQVTTSTKIADGNRDGKCTVNDTSCKNGSDILVVRFQGSGFPTADGTMINCRGEGEAGIGGTSDLNRRAANIFYTARDANTGEPGLYCAYYEHNPLAPAVAGWRSGQPLIEGVESLQILFGTDNVNPGAVPPAALGDTVVDRWLRADQLKVAANPGATRENWRRVRAVRIGMVVRGPVGSAAEKVTASLAPLGSPTFVVSADKGSQLDVAADARLRRVVNFTIHLRNDLSTR